MSDKVIDTSESYLAAAAAADKIDFVRQCHLDDIESMRKKCRAAYIHGYMAAIADSKNEARELSSVLRSHGFVRCDIAACNCGSWHPRYGFYERFNEISEALRDAGYLGNHNGNVALRGVQELIAKVRAAGGDR